MFLCLFSVSPTEVNIKKISEDSFECVTEANILYEVTFAHHRVCEQGKSVVITLMPVIKAIWLMKERIRWLKLLKE